jgi:Transglycosylase SLT domain
MEEILEEGYLGNALLAGAIGLASIGVHHFVRNHPMNQDTGINASMPEKFAVVKSKEERKADIAKSITSKYKHIKPEFAAQVAHLAIKHEHEVFPRAEDIASIVGIESSFNPDAKSKLKKDPAIGLSQIRPKVWGLKKNDLSTPEKQIQHSVGILSSYHSKLGDKEAAIHSYNVGITNFSKGKNLNPSYVEKFKKERELYNSPPLK